MSNIKMTSAILEVVSIKAKTKAKFFERVEVGDKLRFSVEMEYKGGASNGLYATWVKVENLTKDDYTYKSQSEMVSILSRLFDLKQVDE